MSAALKSVFDSHVVANILAFVPLDDYQIETLYGFTHIYGAKHYITYGGGPEGGFVYFISERRRREGVVQVEQGMVRKIGLYQG